MDRTAEWWCLHPGQGLLRIQRAGSWTWERHPWSLPQDTWWEGGSCYSSHSYTGIVILTLSLRDHMVVGRVIKLSAPPPWRNQESIRALLGQLGRWKHYKQRLFFLVLAFLVATVLWALILSTLLSKGE